MPSCGNFISPSIFYELDLIKRRFWMSNCRLLKVHTGNMEKRNSYLHQFKSRTKSSPPVVLKIVLERTKTEVSFHTITYIYLKNFLSHCVSKFLELGIFVDAIVISNERWKLYNTQAGATWIALRLWICSFQWFFFGCENSIQP